MNLRTGIVLAALILSVSPATAQERPGYDLAEIRALVRAAHPSLASAEAAIAAAEASRTRQRLLDDPALLVEAGRAESDGTSGTEWRVELGQRLPLPGHRRWRSRLAEGRLETASQERLVREAALDREVGILWSEILLAERSLEVAVRGEEIAARLLALIERRVEVGEASSLEAVRARSEWFARRHLVLEAERRSTIVRESLDTLCGGALGGGFTIAGELDAAVELPPASELLERALDGARARAAGGDVTASEARVQAERRGALPELELAVARESELDKTGTAVGLLFNLPLWNRNRAAVAVAEAELVGARADREALELELERELAAALAAYREAARTLELFAEGWSAAATETLRIAGFSFENGESSLLELLDAQRSLLEVGLAEARARAALTGARLEIEYLAGPILPKGAQP